MPVPPRFVYCSVCIILGAETVRLGAHVHAAMMSRVEHASGFACRDGDLRDVMGATAWECLGRACAAGSSRLRISKVRARKGPVRSFRCGDEGPGVSRPHISDSCGCFSGTSRITALEKRRNDVGSTRRDQGKPPHQSKVRRYVAAMRGAGRCGRPGMAHSGAEGPAHSGVHIPQ